MQTLAMSVTNRSSRSGILPTISAAAPLPTGEQPRLYNINETSQACQLSPSVLRIWELRYGWPRPKRRANGYRTYSTQQVEDLKRISTLIKSGYMISALIKDGLPKWPNDNNSNIQHRRNLDQARQLPLPMGRDEQRLRDELLQCMEVRHAGRIRQVLDRIAWQVRPRDEVSTALAPALVALAELEAHERGLEPADAHSVKQWVINRAKQLLRVPSANPIQATVKPLKSSDQALAMIVVLALRERGISAVEAQDGIAIQGEVVWVSDQPGETSDGTHVSALSVPDVCGLASLLDRQQTLPLSL